MCLDGEKNDRVAFQARADYQNHAIGWLHRGYSSLGGGKVVRIPRIWMVYGECRVNKELHATDFVAGRGRLGPGVVTKHRRSQIFLGALKLLNRTDGIRIFNICLVHNQNWAFERLLNRINRTMKAWDSQCILFCDEGNEGEYTRLVRKMAVHNPIPSRFGAWKDTGSTTRNIPTDRILEDLFFKNSEKSYFIQMADFCAYALLRREKHLASKNKYGIHKAFDELTDVVVKPANPNDPMGVIR